MAITSEAAFSLSKTLSFLSPLPQNSRTFSFSRPLSSPSSIFLSNSFHKPSLNLHFRPSILRSKSSNGGSDVLGEHHGDEEEEEFEGEKEDYDENEEFLDYEGYQSEGSDEEFFIDEELLETEARVAVREFSTSLRRELGIEDTEMQIRRETGGKQSGENIVPRDIPDHLLPKVAIFWEGQMLVNQHCLTILWGGNRAIVVDEPGVTRDRLYGRSFWGDHEFTVIDTGGVVALSKSQEDVVEDLNVSTTIGMEGIPLVAREAAVARMPSQN